MSGAVLSAMTHLADDVIANRPADQTPDVAMTERQYRTW